MSEELNQVKTILANAIDRDKSDSDTIIMLAHITANAIYWRNKEIENFKQWLLTETGTTDLAEAAKELKRWRLLSGLYVTHPGNITNLNKQ